MTWPPETESENYDQIKLKCETLVQLIEKAQMRWIDQENRVKEHWIPDGYGSLKQWQAPTIKLKKKKPSRDGLAKTHN